MFKQHLVEHVMSRLRIITQFTNELIQKSDLYCKKKKYFLFSLTDLANFISQADEGLLQNVEEGDYDTLVSVMGYLMNVKERQAVTDDMFEPIRLTIELLKSYDQELPEEANVLLQVK